MYDPTMLSSRAVAFEMVPSHSCQVLVQGGTSVGIIPHCWWCQSAKLPPQQPQCEKLEPCLVHEQVPLCLPAHVQSFRDRLQECQSSAEIDTANQLANWQTMKAAAVDLQSALLLQPGRSRLTQDPILPVTFKAPK